jgi:hypothetical protein
MDIHAPRYRYLDVESVHIHGCTDTCTINELEAPQGAPAGAAVFPTLIGQPAEVLPTLKNPSDRERDDLFAESAPSSFNLSRINLNIMP